MQDKKVVAIIQARVGSTRLPNKVLKEIKGKTVLNHVVERVSQSNYIDKIVIATTDLNQDDEIVKECKKIGVSYFRGSESDVLSRYYQAAKVYNANIIVRITSDCPLIDYKIINKVIELYKSNNYDLATNAGNLEIKRTYPRGLDIEVFSIETIKDAYDYAVKEYEKEHVTPYIYENSKRIGYVLNEKNYSNYRWTLDTQEDLMFIECVYDILYHGEHNFYMVDIVKLLKENNHIYDINKEIRQKSIK